MIELSNVTALDAPEGTELWSDEDNWHVIVLETEETYRSAGWYVRDENGERGPLDDFAQAFDAAQKAWGEVTLLPANRLRADIETGRADEVGHFLLEYLADYGAVGIDAQALAKRVFERIGADDEAWQ